MTDVFAKFCPRCGHGTRHRKLERAGFFAQCLIAAITRFGTDLREPESECVECGLRDGEAVSREESTQATALARASDLASEALGKAAASSKVHRRGQSK